MTGKVVAIHCDFGFNASDSEKYPDSPFYQHHLGGGGLLFVGESHAIKGIPISFSSMT